MGRHPKDRPDRTESASTRPMKVPAGPIARKHHVQKLGPIWDDKQRFHQIRDYYLDPVFDKKGRLSHYRRRWIVVARGAPFFHRIYSSSVSVGASSPLESVGVKLPANLEHWVENL